MLHKTVDEIAAGMRRAAERGGPGAEWAVACGHIENLARGSDSAEERLVDIRRVLDALAQATR